VSFKPAQVGEFLTGLDKVGPAQAAPGRIGQKGAGTDFQLCQESDARPEKNVPVRSRQLQTTILVAIAVLVTAILVSLVRTAEHQVTAAGIVLQTLAGLFAAMQLWANNASDAVLRWTAKQIDSNRWRIAGLLNGRPCSLLIATVWFASAYLVLLLFGVWNPDEIIGLLVAIILVANFVVSALILLLALLMYFGAQLLDGEPLPDGEASTALEARLAASNWIWPFVALAFLAGGILQVAAA
jgi:hypothetical protein